jgi:hypothetical protein
VIQRSQPWQPYHTHKNPEPVKPGEIIEYEIEVRPTSNVFKAGHRIQLEICSLELPAAVVITEKGPMTSHLACSRTVMHKIYRNEKYQSYLLLPVIPETIPSMGCVKLARSNVMWQTLSKTRQDFVDCIPRSKFKTPTQIKCGAENKTRILWTLCEKNF